MSAARCGGSVTDLGEECEVLLHRGEGGGLRSTVRLRAEATLERAGMLPPPTALGHDCGAFVSQLSAYCLCTCTVTVGVRILGGESVVGIRTLPW
jgi:hypothetical protein